MYLGLYEKEEGLYCQCSDTVPVTVHVYLCTTGVCHLLFIMYPVTMVMSTQLA